jgi:undecaprenyl pyrophosphate synthase
MYIASMMNKALNSKWSRDLLMNIAQQGPIPEHIGLIMDGNRRFARTHDMPIEQGHRLGAAAMTKVRPRSVQKYRTRLTVEGPRSVLSRRGQGNHGIRVQH